MEINITEFYNNADTYEYSNSIHNSGLRDIGIITWNNAKRSRFTFSFTQTIRRKFLSFLEDCGMDDVWKMNMNETKALFIQMVSGDIQEKQQLCDTWDEYMQLSEDGQVSGNLYNVDGEIFYTIG